MNGHQTEIVSLGASQLRVSLLGVGTNDWGSNRQADPGLQPVFETALELGINFFDTAEIYGLGGSERTLGQFLPAGGQKVVITTKFFPMPWRLRKPSLEAALRESLRRLQVPRVDLYLIHFPIPPVAIETWMEALAEAVQAGLTQAVGVSNFNPEQMARAHAVLAKRGIPLACNQVEYSLLKRGPERNGLLSLCRALDVTLVAYRPVASGLLAGKYSLENPPQGWRKRLYNRQVLANLQPLLDLLGQLGNVNGGKTPTQVALNWLICKGALPIPGATKVEHVRENAGALGWRLADDEVAALDRASQYVSIQL
jgi:aryl-alcohol dehydrogenase-like predicted oxidoreductase